MSKFFIHSNPKKILYNYSIIFHNKEQTFFVKWTKTGSLVMNLDSVVKKKACFGTKKCVFGQKMRAGDHSWSDNFILCFQPRFLNRYSFVYLRISNKRKGEQDILMIFSFFLLFLCYNGIGKTPKHTERSICYG